MQISIQRWRTICPPLPLNGLPQDYVESLRMTCNARSVRLALRQEIDLFRLHRAASVLRELAKNVSRMFHFSALRFKNYVLNHLLNGHVFSRFLRAFSRTFRRIDVKSQLLCQLS